MSRRLRPQINKSAIRKHVGRIADQYEREWARQAPDLPLVAGISAGGAPVQRGGPMPDPYGRGARVRQAFLRWLVEHPQEHPGWDAFLEEVPEVDGSPVLASERDDAVQRLLDDGMLDGPTVEERAWPTLLELTATGRRCAQDFDYDTVAYGRYVRGESMTYHDHRDQRNQRVYAQGASGQIAAHSPGAQQHQDLVTDVRNMRGAARYLLANLDDLTEEGFEDRSIDDVRQQATELAEAASEETPDHRMLRRLATRLNTTLLTHPLTAGIASGATSGTASALLTQALGKGA